MSLQGSGTVYGTTGGYRGRTEPNNMRKEDRAKIKLLWRVVLGIMDKIDKIAEAYTPEEIEADIEDAIKAVRNDKISP